MPRLHCTVDNLILKIHCDETINSLGILAQKWPNFGKIATLMSIGFNVLKCFSPEKCGTLFFLTLFGAFFPSLAPVFGKT